MPSRLPNLKFFSGRSNLPLAESIVSYDGFNLSEAEIVDFANKEIKVKIKESIRGEDVFILQTCSHPDPNKWLMELLIMAHTAKMASAKRITAVVPYIYGSRQDRKSEPRTPITIQLVGSLFKAAGIHNLITVSLHNHASVGAFNDIIVDNVSSFPAFIKDISSLINEEEKDVPFIVLSPDSGGVERAKHYANHFHTDLGFTYKTRPQDNVAKVLAFVGDVKDKNVLIVDDIVDTAGTLISVAAQAKARGAKKVFVCVTHAVLSKNAVENINASEIDRMYVTNSIYHEGLVNMPCISLNKLTIEEKFRVIDIGPLLGEVILRVNGDKSVGELFEDATALQRIVKERKRG